MLAVRVWPAREYTRIALELDEALRHSELLVLDPPRLVVDLEGLELDNALRELVAKVRTELIIRESCGCVLSDQK